MPVFRPPQPGILAWRWALEGQLLKGILRLHLLLGCAVVFAPWLTVGFVPVFAH
jgi:hypothetical protein